MYIQHLVVKFVGRGANTVAHSLSRHPLENHPNKFTFYDVPICIQTFISKEMN